MIEFHIGGHAGFIDGDGVVLARRIDTGWGLMNYYSY